MTRLFFQSAVSVTLSAADIVPNKVVDILNRNNEICQLDVSEQVSIPFRLIIGYAIETYSLRKI